MRSARSRFTRVPAFHSPRVVRESDSAETSTLKERGVIATTVRQQPAQATEATPPPVEAAKPTETAHRPKPAETQQTGGSFVDSLLEYWWVLALLVVAVAGYFGFKTWRSRRQSEFDDSLSRLAVAGVNGGRRQRNGGSSKLRNLRECSEASSLRSRFTVSRPICRCSLTARW